MNNYEESFEKGKATDIDNKVIKKHYPRTNNDSVLEFILEKDPNLCLRKNKIQIHATVEVDEGYVVENGFASKLFSMLSVEIDSQLISSNKTR